MTPADALATGRWQAGTAGARVGSDRLVAAIAAAAVAARLAAFAGLELYADEAYYWLWSQRLSAGYFDHPPLVAWVAALGRQLPGELGLRLPFALLGGLAVWLAGCIATELSDDPRAPALAALLAAAAPLLQLTGGMALPDAPVQAAYAAATWLVARAERRGWIAAGLAMGMALLTKYTAALGAPALLLLVVLDPDLRRQLRSPWPWLGGATALVLFAPCLLWNAGHGWISIGFQLGHGFGAGRAPGAGRFLDFAAGQLAGVGPVALILGIAGLARCDTSARRRVAALTLLPLLVFAAAALRGPVEANWPSQVIPALAAAAAALLLRLPSPWRLWLTALQVGTGVALLALFTMEIRMPYLLRGSAAVERFHTGRNLAEAARAAIGSACQRAGGAPTCGRSSYVVADSYQVAAELAYYGGPWILGPTPARFSQFDLWASPPPPGEPVVFIGRAAPAALTLGGELLERRNAPAALELDYRGDRLLSLQVIPFGPVAGRASARLP